MSDIYIESIGADNKNQDRVSSFTHAGSSVIVLADGAGGTRGGEIAAEIAIDSATKVLQQQADITMTTCMHAIQVSDQAIYLDREAGNTTVVIAIIQDETIFGASAGDSEAWLISNNQYQILTSNQDRKPLLGSSKVIPTHFGPAPHKGTLLVGSDGLFKYVQRNKILTICRDYEPSQTPQKLTTEAQLPNGSYQDDITLAVCRRDHSLSK